MTTFLMMNDHNQFGRNSSVCMMNNRKSIKDLIKKFDKTDNKRDKLAERIDLISTLNNLKTSINNNDLKENIKPISLNFDTITIPTQSHQHHEPVQMTVLEKKDSNSLKFETISLEDESFNNYSTKFQRGNHLNEKTSKIEIVPTTPPNEILSWNHSRRRSSVQLVKPSSLIKNKNTEIYEKKEIEIPHAIILPRRVSGPIYESRRSSFSAIKPSEIWNSEELPNVIRRNSQLFDEKLNIKRKKSVVIDEIDEGNEDCKSSWVTKPKNSVYLVKPSNVKSVETQNQTSKKAPETIQSKLLKWCQQQTKNYDVEIKNFSSSWANGLAFCALIHSFKPTAFNYDELSEFDRRKNFEIAFDAAEQYADIPPLLEVDDMITMGDKPDSKCVFTYVSTMFTKLNKLKQQKS